MVEYNIVANDDNLKFTHIFMNNSIIITYNEQKHITSILDKLSIKDINLIIKFWYIYQKDKQIKNLKIAEEFVSNVKN